MTGLVNAVLLALSSVVSCVASSCTGLDCDAIYPSVSLVQMGLAIRNNTFRCAPVQKIWDQDGRYEIEGVCGEDHYRFPFQDSTKYYPGSPAEKELERPLMEVRREHGQEDLFYHFGMLNDWISPTSAFPPNSSYESLKQAMMTSQGLKFPKPVQMRFKWDGGEINTYRDHQCQAADDPYCYANGWMKNQNPALNPSTLDDPEAYSRFAEDQCRKMNEKYHFDQDNITMLSHLHETNAMYEMSDNACDLMESKGPLPTNRDFLKHSYVKCLMNSARVEIAYCYFRGCTMEGNRIGHGNECDY